MPGERPPRRGRALAGLAVGILLLLVPVAWWAAGTGAAPPPRTPPPSSAPVAGSIAAGPVTATAPAPPPVTPGAPVQIRMPGIGVDAPVVPVGVDPKGEMEVPEDVRSVGWYRFGPGPGAGAGSSVLAGHVDDQVQGRGAFYQLIELAPGDEVQVRLADGAELRYRVRAVDRVDKSRLPVDALFTREGAPQLTLITCGGEFDRSAGRFRDNVVVIADPMPAAQ